MNKENDEEIIENTLEINEEMDTNKKGNIPFTNIKPSKNENENSINNNTSYNENNKDTINTQKIYDQKNVVQTFPSTEIMSERNIDLKSSHFPYCIVWTPIPIITYLIPSIGHTGIGNSSGIIHDFASSFFVSVDDFAFGKPTKYIKLELTEQEKYDWDRAILKGDNRYNMEEHNIFVNNCHSHVAYVLNQLNYKGRNNYNMVSIWWMLITKGKYVSFCGFFKTYIGFLIVVFIILIIILIKE